MFDAHAQKNILKVMLQIFDNLFHYKNIATVQWIKRFKLCMVTMATLPPAKELKIQVVSWQIEIRTLDVLKSPTCAGDGETPVASAKCLMSLIGHLLRPVGTSPPCFSFTRFIVEQCLLKKTSI